MKFMLAIASIALVLQSLLTHAAPLDVKVYADGIPPH